MSGAKHGRNGKLYEREIVDRHKAIGIHAERYPLSGASRFRGGGHDVDLYLFGRDEAPAVCEVKKRKSGNGFTTITSWLGENDLLFLRQNNMDPIAVVPWATWARLIGQLNHTPAPRRIADGVSTTCAPNKELNSK